MKIDFDELMSDGLLLDLWMHVESCILPYYSKDTYIAKCKYQKIFIVLPFVLKFRARTCQFLFISEYMSAN